MTWCHNPFPVIIPIVHICPVPLGLTPFSSYHALQVTPINPNYAQLYLRVLSPSVHGQGPEHLLECTPSASGMQRPSKIMWPSHDHHATTHHLHHLSSRPPSQQMWDLRVPTLFLFNLFSSYYFSDCSTVVKHIPVLIPDLESNCMHPCALFTSPSLPPPYGQPP